MLLPHLWRTSLINHNAVSCRAPTASQSFNMGLQAAMPTGSSWLAKRKLSAPAGLVRPLHRLIQQWRLREVTQLPNVTLRVQGRAKAEFRSPDSLAGVLTRKITPAPFQADSQLLMTEGQGQHERGELREPEYLIPASVAPSFEQQ